MNRNQFPILKNTVYLDSAASMLKPKIVVKAMNDFYLNYPLNSHSAESKLGVKLMTQISNVRQQVAKLVDASAKNVIFTSGTTMALNNIASMLETYINQGDEILLSSFNHVSNIVPWMEIAKNKKARVLIVEDILENVSSKTKIISFSQLNNSLQHSQKQEEIFIKAKEVGAIVINDAAQAIAHENVSLKNSDFIVFSGNKIYGPTGIGVWVTTSDWLAKLNPNVFGGGAVSMINQNTWEKKDGYLGFEPGTLNTSGIIGLGAAIEWFNKNNLDNEMFDYEKQLAKYAYDKLGLIKDITIYSKRGDKIILFNIGKYSSQDVVSYLGHKNILLRSGDHCAKLINNDKEKFQAIRLSVASYNTKGDINKLIKTLSKGGDFLGFL